MSSSILHHCPFCGQTTDVSTALAAFIENPHCSQCGLSTSESNSKMQDDLAALFARQMTMGAMDTVEAPPPVSSSQEAPIVYSSMHYTHSAHVPRHVPQKSSDSSSLSDISSASTTEDMLRNHAIDPASLSREQLELFTHAEPEQKSRLVQIWQICQESSNTQRQDLEMNDFAQHAKQDGNQYADAEPYMVSGYEILARRDYDMSAEESTPRTLPNEPTTGTPYKPASDPIYQSQRWWEHSTPQQLEDQYGAFEMNRYAGCGVVQPHWA